MHRSQYLTVNIKNTAVVGNPFLRSFLFVITPTADDFGLAS